MTLPSAPKATSTPKTPSTSTTPDQATSRRFRLRRAAAVLCAPLLLAAGVAVASPTAATEPTQPGAGTAAGNRNTAPRGFDEAATFSRLDRETAVLQHTRAGAVERRGDDSDATSEAPADPSRDPDRVRAVSEGVEPFDLIGVALTGPADGDAFVRVRTGTGWSAWHDLSIDDGHGPDDAPAPPGPPGTVVTEPVWVGWADGWELSLPSTTTAAEVLITRPQVVPPAPRATAPATFALPGGPAISTRSSWGARPSTRTPVIGPTVRMAIVHHTATDSGYTAEEVPGILRSIQSFHIDGRGWGDIGYNFLVDRFGRAWEGREGGITNAVIGAHALGSNYLTTGIAAIGNFSETGPPRAVLDAVGDLSAWKLGLHGTDPGSLVEHRTSADARFPRGTVLRLPAIAAHRDVNVTACPGDLLFPQLEAIRARARTTYAASSGGGFVPAPAIGINAAGRPEIFAVGRDRQIWHSWSTADDRWSPWVPIGGRVAGRPEVVTNTDGRLEVFAVGVDGALWHAWQVAPNSRWSGVSSLGGRLSSDIGLAAGRNSDGRLEVFAVTDHDHMRHLWQAATPNGWSGWQSLAGITPPSTSNMEVVNNAAGLLKVFTIYDDGTVKHLAQEPARPSGWSPVQGLGGGFASGLSVGRNADGRLELFGVTRSGRLAHQWELEPGGGWSAVRDFGVTVPTDGGTAVATNADGRLEVFVVRSDQQVWHAWQSPAVGGWDQLIPNGGRTTGWPAAQRRADGRLVVSVVESTLWRGWASQQVAPSSPWAPWRTIP